MRRATPLEQVQTVPLMLHAQGQVGCLVECSHRKGVLAFEFMICINVSIDANDEKPAFSAILREVMQYLDGYDFNYPHSHIYHASMVYGRRLIMSSPYYTIN